jgi:nucleoid DNA-binding protein
MIVEIISKYLETNKRLVVPNLGAFIVKEAGRTVLFSNLIKGDDGVLRSLLISSGVSELEAAAAIDRFVFEVNFRLESRGECMLSGFGELRNGVNGTIAFTFSPSVKGENLDGNIAVQKPAVAEQEPMQSAPQPPPQPASAPQKEREEENAVEEDVRIDVVPRKEPAVRRVEPMAERQRDGRQVRRANPSDDYVKGLRYGKGRKVVTGREGATSRKSQKSDIIMKIAIFAAVLAILALAYGVYNEWRVSHFDEPFISNTEIYEQEPVSAEKEMRNPDLDYITPKGN